MPLHVRAKGGAVSFFFSFFFDHKAKSIYFRKWSLINGSFVCFFLWKYIKIINNKVECGWMVDRKCSSDWNHPVFTQCDWILDFYLVRRVFLKKKKKRSIVPWLVFTDLWDTLFDNRFGALCIFTIPNIYFLYVRQNKIIFHVLSQFSFHVSTNDWISLSISFLSNLARDRW